MFTTNASGDTEKSLQAYIPASDVCTTPGTEAAAKAMKYANDITGASDKFTGTANTCHCGAKTAKPDNKCT